MYPLRGGGSRTIISGDEVKHMRKETSTLFADMSVCRQEGLYALHTGGKTLLTPAKHPYLLPTKALAEEIAREWRAQGRKVEPATMPMTQLAATALDIVAMDSERIVRQIIAYASTELLCHRVEHPPQLAAHQSKVWQPLLEWCAVRFGALLKADTGVMPIEQTAEAVIALHEAVSSYDAFKLAGLNHAVEVAGSLVLGLALAEGERNSADVFKAAELDSSFQALAWGADPVATARFEAVRCDLDTCEKWFALLKG